MSVRLLSAVFDSALPSTTRLVALALADYASDDGRGIYPSLATVAAKTGLSVRSVKLHVRNLVTSSVLVVEDQRRVRGGAIPVYRMDVDRLQPGAGGSPGQPGAGDAPGADEGQDPGQEVPRVSHDPGQEMHPNRQSYPLEDQNRNARAKEDEDFETFWTTYPRRHGRGKAREAFSKAAAKAGVDVVLSGAAAFAADPNLPPPEEAAYIALPATWLNQERWRDDPLPLRPGRPGHIDDEAAIAARLTRKLSAVPS